MEQTANGIEIADGESLSVANRSLSVAATDRKQAIIDLLETNGQAKTSDLTEAVDLKV